MSIRSIGESARPAPATPAPPIAPPLRASRAADETSPFELLLRGIGREAAAGEATMRGVIHATERGRDLAPAELLALQAGVYRYSEAIDLAAKLIDRATSGVKTVISGQ